MGHNLLVTLPVKVISQNDQDCFHPKPWLESRLKWLSIIHLLQDCKKLYSTITGEDIWIQQFFFWMGHIIPSFKAGMCGLTNLWAGGGGAEVN